MQESSELEQEVFRLRQENQKLKDTLGKGQKASGFDWRKFGAWVLLTLGFIAIIPASLLVWLNRTIINPETYIQTIGPVIEQPAVQNAVTKTASEKLLANVDINQIVADSLPEKAQFLAEPIASQAEGFTTQAIAKIVASQKFNDLWVKANQRAQSSFIRIAENPNSNPTINLDEVYSFISTELQGTKLAPLLNKNLPPKIGEIPVANVPALEKIPHFVTALDSWRWVFVGLSLVLFALSVWVARESRRMIAWVGAALIMASIVILATVRITRAIMLDKISDPTYKEAALAVWQTVLNPFFIQVAVMFTLGLAAVIVSYLLGSSKLALKLRTGTGHQLSMWRSSILPTADQIPALAFLQRNRRKFEWGVLISTIALLLIFMPLTVQVALTILGVALLALILVEFLSAPTINQETE